MPSSKARTPWWYWRTQETMPRPRHTGSPVGPFSHMLMRWAQSGFPRTAAREDVDGGVEVDAGIVVHVPVGGREGAVDRPVAQPQIPGLLGIPGPAGDRLALDEADRPVGVLIRRVSFEIFGLTAMIRNGLIVVVMTRRIGVRRAIPDDLEVPVAAVAGVDAGVPFADLRRVVPVLAEDLGPERRQLRDRSRCRDSRRPCASTRPRTGGGR